MKIVPAQFVSKTKVSTAQFLEATQLYRGFAALRKLLIGAFSYVICALPSAPTANADIACYAHKSTDCSVTWRRHDV
ncbi:MAG: hypothetical protein DME97_00130 [Verrucomicrobia bacterium]|nr:MAG: hypothetical protein DME97_00130 [Verrucomicrobiota bacterium]